MFLNQAYGRRNGCIGEAAVIFNDEFQGAFKDSTAFIDFVASDLRRSDYFFAVDGNHPGERRHDSKMDGVDGMDGMGGGHSRGVYQKE